MVGVDDEGKNGKYQMVCILAKDVVLNSNCLLFVIDLNKTASFYFRGLPRVNIIFELDYCSLDPKLTPS